MLNKKEISAVGIVVLIFSLAMSLTEERIEGVISFFLLILIVIIGNIAAKKIAAFHFDSKIEIKIWEVEQYWFKAHQHFKKPFPAGIFVPLISKLFLLPLKSFVWLASLVFEAKPEIHKAAKRHGLEKFSDITEKQIGLIAASGIVTNLVFALIGYLINFPEFAKLNIYYAFFNVIPLSNLDGSKILFGNVVLWIVLTSITIISFLLTLI